MIWGIFLGILAVLALLGRTRLGIRGVYTQQEAGLWLRIGAFQWQLYPGKKKKASRKPQKAPEPSRQKKGREEPKAPFLSPNGMFQLGKRLLPVALEGANAFRRRLQVDVLHGEILVGDPDPATAAERYGQVNALLGALWQPAVQVLHIQDGKIHVGVDFERSAPALYGRLSLSMTASQLLWLGLRYGPKCLGIFLDVRKQDKAAGTQQRKAA